MGSLSFEHPLISCIYPFSFLAPLNLHNYYNLALQIYSFVWFLFLTHGSLSFEKSWRIFSFSSNILAISAIEYNKSWNLPILRISNTKFWNPLILRILDEPPCYGMQAVVACNNCLRNKCLSHAI